MFPIDSTSTTVTRFHSQNIKERGKKWALKNNNNEAMKDNIPK